MQYFGPKNEKGYRCTFVVFKSFPKVGWTVRLKHKIGQTMKVAGKTFSVIRIKPKCD